MNVLHVFWKLNFLSVVRIMCVVQPMSCEKCKCIILKLEHVFFFFPIPKHLFLLCMLEHLCLLCILKWGDGEMQGLLQIIRRDKLLVPKLDYFIKHSSFLKCSVAKPKVLVSAYLWTLTTHMWRMRNCMLPWSTTRLFI